MKAQLDGANISFRMHMEMSCIASH